MSDSSPVRKKSQTKKSSSRTYKSDAGSSSVPLHPHPASFVQQAYPLLLERYGQVSCALHYSSPHELAVAVILSAQCTDQQVNRVTPALFQKYSTPVDLAEAPLEELERLIYTTGFYHNKARNIKGFARTLVEEHGGEIPRTLEELVKMPGVGRKTANVILQELFQIPSGVVVDTHVSRLSRVMGLTQKSDPVQIERVLMELLPREWWINWSLYMIRLGRSVCPARKRECPACSLQEICLSSSVRTTPLS